MDQRNGSEMSLHVSCYHTKYTTKYIHLSPTTVATHTHTHTHTHNTAVPFKIMILVNTLVLTVIEPPRLVPELYDGGDVMDTGGEHLLVGVKEP